MAIILALFLLFGQQENPRARAASIYPHPPEPEKLVQHQINAQFLLIEKHWFWTTSEPFQGTIRIEQARPKGGWWVSGNRITDVDGKLADIVELNPDWPQHVIFILLDGRNQVASVETDLDKPMTFKIRRTP